MSDNRYIFVKILIEKKIFKKIKGIPIRYKFGLKNFQIICSFISDLKAKSMTNDQIMAKIPSENANHLKSTRALIKKRPESAKIKIVERSKKYPCDQYFLRKIADNKIKYKLAIK